MNEVQGAMYAFPKVELPQKVIELAKVNLFNCIQILRI